MTTAKCLVGLVLAGAAACGTMEGDVYGTDSAVAGPMPDVEVLLVKQSDSLMKAVAQFCLDERKNEVQRDTARKRLERRAAQLKDSAAAIYGLEYQSPRWHQIMAASAAAADSGNQISVANADPVEVAQAAAVKRGRSDASGHYRISRVWVGRYFLVPMVRESEFAPVQWYPTRMWLAHKRANANGRDGWAGCHLTGTDSLEAGSN